ncbi:MAG: hypothetical protein J6S28_02645, partial [Clostridia bacterium]|nr:hypothetical protein [Clostridia bacterium]
SINLTFSKVLIKLFQKFAGTWDSVPSRARRRETSPTPFLVLFAAILPKRTERISSMSHIRIHSVLFLEQVAARKSTKKNGEKEISPLRRRRGLRALDRAAF